MDTIWTRDFGNTLIQALFVIIFNEQYLSLS